MSGLKETATGLKLIAVAERLRAIEADRVAGVVKPVQAGDMRQKALCDGVMTMAQHLGVSLKPIHSIDARGELPIVSEGANPWNAAGVPFSDSFCSALNIYCKPRCGMPGTVAVMESGHSNWCRIWHFDAEIMVCAVADAIESENKKV